MNWATTKITENGFLLKNKPKRPPGRRQEPPHLAR
nr:MAG TPA: hypothetical protein [Caudoviricetes sp.]